jgi:cytochrome c553
MRFLPRPQKQMKLLKPFCLALPLALFFAQPAVAAEPGASPAAKANQCVGCHEIPGYRSVFPAVYPTPKIMGQSAAYIQTALKAYRDGTRDHPSMTGIAATLSDEDIRVLAEYYAGRGK